jgi:hypothetical protein
MECDEVDGMSQAQHMVYLYTQDCQDPGAPATTIAIAMAQDFSLML